MIESGVFLGLLAALKIAWSTIMTRAFFAKSGNAFEEIKEELNPRLVSVVVCIRDGAQDWKNLWHALCSQSYEAAWELIVVDDGSTDETPTLLLETVELESSIPIRVIRLDGTSPGKKEALLCGVKAARGDWLLFTDVDCIPASSRWIECMITPAAQGADTVLGISWPRAEKPRNMLSNLQVLDAIMVARSYIGWAHRGHPYMGVGRNWSVRKSRFPETAGPEGLASGDDDLAVQALVGAGGLNFATVVDRAGQSDTRLPATWTGWARQKRRHWTTAPHYSSGDQWRLLVPKLINAAMVALALGVLIQGIQGGVLHNALWIIGCAFGCSWLVEVRNFRSITKACQTPISWWNCGWFLPLWSVWVVCTAAITTIRHPNRADW